VVSPSQSAPIDWVALRGWYATTDEVLAIFDRCCAASRRLLDGDAAASLDEASRLGALTVEADDWLRSHPCPHGPNGDWVTSIVRLFTVITDMIVVTEGVELSGNGTLRTMIDDACDSVTEFRGLVVRVGSSPPP